MPSVTMVSRLLDAADLLIDQKPTSAAFRRRAVSTAYYATFHALAKICADTLFSEGDPEEYERVYRALDHGPLKNAFAREPLRNRAPFSEIGNVIVLLQTERHRADYLPPRKGAFTRKRAKELVDQARAVVQIINGLEPRDRRVLAAWLLFKSRQL
jgi:uncharacterized protein (UPF0332 family)